MLSEESVELCFLATFNIISYIFPGNFINFIKMRIFTFSILTLFVNFLNFLTSTCYKN